MASRCRTWEILRSHPELILGNGRRVGEHACLVPARGPDLDATSPGSDSGHLTSTAVTLGPGSVPVIRHSSRRLLPLLIAHPGAANQLRGLSKYRVQASYLAVAFPRLGSFFGEYANLVPAGGLSLIKRRVRSPYKLGQGAS
jgi:hypothetical protein